MSEWSQALSAPATAEPAGVAETISGNRGLQIEEPLLFEQDSPGHCGVDLPEPPSFRSRLGGLERRAPIGLPGLSEPQVVRHFTRLSQKNYAIDSGLYPLGSCTMKHNPRLNEKLARLPGFADLHPLQPEASVQGAFELIDTLAHWLKTLTGMPRSRCPRPPGRMANCAASWRSARRSKPAATAASAFSCRNRRMAPTLRRQRPAAMRSRRSRPIRAAGSTSPPSNRSLGLMSRR